MYTTIYSVGSVKGEKFSKSLFGVHNKTACKFLCKICQNGHAPKDGQRSIEMGSSFQTLPALTPTRFPLYLSNNSQLCANLTLTPGPDIQGLYCFAILH